MTTFRNAIHKETMNCHIIDLETANLNDYIIDGLYGGEANNSAIELNTGLPVNIDTGTDSKEFHKNLNDTIINNAIAKNKTNKK